MREETAAIKEILRLARARDLEVVGSSVLSFELERAKSKERRRELQEMAAAAGRWMGWSLALDAESRKLVEYGFSPVDAAHLATALGAECDAFITVDDGILRKARRKLPEVAMLIESPLTWIGRKRIV